MGASNTYQTIRLRDIATSERPQERLERLGAEALSDIELLAMLLRSGTPKMDVLSIAGKLMNEAGSLAKLTSWNENDFKEIKGIGKVKALQLQAVMEIARRILSNNATTTKLFDQPESVFSYFQSIVTGLEIEKFWVLCLNRRNRLLKKKEVSSGTASSSLAHPREVFREAIKSGACAIICVHNHPSGDPSPSSADIKTTRQLREASRTIGIELIDHLIIGNRDEDPSHRGFYSFKEAGLL
ncbi:MAG: DNA repair protein RadC [Opitutaceae bacterium]|nr:DNA repair protein RadC [Opitutaceae bacterium]